MTGMFLDLTSVVYAFLDRGSGLRERQSGYLYDQMSRWRG
jgi:hypothetical protein